MAMTSAERKRKQRQNKSGATITIELDLEQLSTLKEAYALQGTYDTQQEFLAMCVTRGAKFVANSGSSKKVK